MIAQLNALTISEIEMSQGQFMLMNHPGDDLFQAARKKLDLAGIRCVSYYSATVKGDQDLENALRFAKVLGARNITGDATGSILARIDERCSQENLTFGIHNHFFKGENSPMKAQRMFYEYSLDFRMPSGLRPISDILRLAVMTLWTLSAN